MKDSLLATWSSIGRVVMASICLIVGFLFIESGNWTGAAKSAMAMLFFIALHTID